MNKEILIEKKEKFNEELKSIKTEVTEFLKVKFKDIRLVYAYAFNNITTDEFNKISKFIVNENTDNLIDLDDFKNYKKIEIISKPGQYVKKEDMVNDVLNMVFAIDDVKVRYSEIILIDTNEDIKKLEDYFINTVDSYKGDLNFEIKDLEESDYKIKEVEDFINLDDESLKGLLKDYAMDFDDIKYIQNHYKKLGKNPTYDEMNIIDTYWSDHCRHTTFMTQIDDIKIENGSLKTEIESTLKDYMDSKEYTGRKDKPITLMELATINQRELLKKGLLDDKEDTDEVNACSLKVKLNVLDEDNQEKYEDYLFMFKNETHNHPTEIEPYGGANTCIGGGIRDPLSGRSFVYNAMRLTGGGNPLSNYDETLKNKLPQRYIFKKAMKGYSDYGNDIGLAGGYVKEFFNKDYVAKRMELGALVSIAKAENVTRGKSEKGDKILLLGANTGRDGLLAAVGSSKVQTEKNLKDKAESQVQKGNAFKERNIIRLFNNEKASRLIKKCNDFGAGGVSVAVGELADSLNINLDNVNLKYKGLNAGEIALSESQERMAVVIDKNHVDEFLAYCKEEDVNGKVIAEVTDDNHMIMNFRNEKVIDIDKKFLDSNGAEKHIKIELLNPKEDYFKANKVEKKEEALKEIFSNLKNQSLKTLSSNFDSTINSVSVLNEYGGKYLDTKEIGMVSKIPVCGNVENASIMTFGFDEDMGKISPYHMGYYSTVESVIKNVLLGGDREKIRLSFQEFFEKLNKDSKKWGKPFLALLGAYKVMKHFNIPAIGGKDSMSGTFNEIDVPPTLVSFAVSLTKINKVNSRALKNPKDKLVLLHCENLENGLLNLEKLSKNLDIVSKLIEKNMVKAISNVSKFGALKEISEMAFGNRLGVKFNKVNNSYLFNKNLGDILIEIKDEDLKELEKLGISEDLIVLGEVTDSFSLEFEDEKIYLLDLLNLTKSLEKIYPSIKPSNVIEKRLVDYEGFENSNLKKTPKVLMPILVGTTGEIDLENKFKKEGAEVKKIVIKMDNREDYLNSIEEFKLNLKDSDILAFPSGRLMGYVPLGKMYLKNFIDTVKDSIDEFLKKEKSLILGLGSLGLSLVETDLVKDENVVLGPNDENIYLSKLCDFKIINNNSPWLNKDIVNSEFSAPISTDYGKLLFKDYEKSFKNKNIAITYLNENSTNSENGVVGLVYNNGKTLIMLSNIDRNHSGLYKNYDFLGKSNIIKSGVEFFK